MNSRTRIRAVTGPELKGVVWTVLLLAGVAASIIAARPCIFPLFEARECKGGTHLGIVLGVAGFAAICFSMAYALRKDWAQLSVFRLEQWLYSHVVIGTISLALILFHAGFHLQNLVGALALLFLALTVLSGVAGLFFIYYFPRFQARHETSVLIPEDLCRRLSTLYEEASELCSGREGPFLDVYNEALIPLYKTRVGRTPPSADVSPWADGVRKEDLEDFMHLASKVEEVHDTLVLLGRNMRFRWYIQGWLLFHIPATIGLMVFSIVHIVSITWYGVK